MLADLFERYVSVEVLLEKLSANSACPIYVEALRDVLGRSTEKFAEARGRSLLAIFGDAVETLSIDPGMLASRIPNLANIEIASHSKFFKPNTLRQLKKCGGPLWDFAFESVRANLDSFDKDTWVAKLSSATPRWSPRAAVEIGYAWTSLAQEGAKEVLRMVVTGRMPNDAMPSEETWNMLVADFESKHIGVGEWFKDLKDQIIDFSGTITAKAFAFLAPWLFKYASFGVNKDELRKLLPDATVRRDASCKKLMAENKDAVMQMFNKGDATTQDAFKACVTAEINAHPDSPLSVFKEIIGGK